MTKSTEPQADPPAPLIEERSPEPIEGAHRAAVAAGLDDLSRGRLATQTDVDEVYARFRRSAR